jgi:hypothetical protein
VMVSAIAGTAARAAASMKVAFIIFDLVMPLERTADNRARQLIDAFIVNLPSGLRDAYMAGNCRLKHVILTDGRTETTRG